jgi:DNA-binding HxlR family transcriptional regulator
MQEQLEQISDAERAVFKNKIAGRIYLELKSRPRKFSELKLTIGCSSNSLTANLNKGRQIGVWEKSGDQYRLASRGKDLPDIIAVHAKLQYGATIEYRGQTLQHANARGGSSIVTDATNGGIVFEFDERYSDVEIPEGIHREAVMTWFHSSEFSDN